MNINDFINSLTNELNKNLFCEVEIKNIYNNYDKTHLIYINAKRGNKKYEYGYSVHEKWLNGECVNEIVNMLLNQ